MKRSVYLSFGVTLFFSLAACQDDTNRVISQHVSPGGHEFQLMPINERGVSDITVSGVWASDWISTAGANIWAPGLASEVIMSGGTAELSPADVLDMFEEKNTRGQIYSTVGMTFGEVEFPNNHQDEVVPVLAELFQAPRYDTAWFERIRGQWFGRVTKSNRPLVFELWDASRYAIFGEGPQTDFLNGTDVAALKTASIEDLKAWHSEIFARSPLALVVTGATDAEQAGTIIDELLLPPGNAPLTPKPVQQAEFPDKMIYLHDPDAEKSTLGFIGPMPDTTDGLDGLDLVITHLFGSGADSPLFEKIRTKLGATYGLTVELVNYTRSQRVLAISGEIDTAKMAEARLAVEAAYQEFLTSPDMSLLGDFTTRIADSIRQNQQYVSSSAVMIRELLLDGRDPQEYYNLADGVAELTAEDIEARLDAAYPKTLSVFAAGPDPSAFPEACVITQPRQAADC